MKQVYFIRVKNNYWKPYYIADFGFTALTASNLTKFKNNEPVEIALSDAQLQRVETKDGKGDCLKAAYREDLTEWAKRNIAKFESFKDCAQIEVIELTAGFSPYSVDKVNI